MNTTDHQAAFHVRTCDTGHYGSTKAICRKIVKQGKIIFIPIPWFNMKIIINLCRKFLIYLLNIL